MREKVNSPCGLLFRTLQIRKHYSSCSKFLFMRDKNWTEPRSKHITHIPFTPRSIQLNYSSTKVKNPNKSGWQGSVRVSFCVLTWLLVSGTAVSFFWSELFLAVLAYPEGLRLLSHYARIFPAIGLVIVPNDSTPVLPPQYCFGLSYWIIQNSLILTAQ